MCAAMLHLHIGRPPTHARTHVRTPSCVHRQLAMPHTTSTTCTPTGFHSTIHSPSGPPQDPTACRSRSIPQGCPHALTRAADANHDPHASTLTCRRRIGEGREERGAEGAEGCEEDTAVTPTHTPRHECATLSRSMMTRTMNNCADAVASPHIVRGMCHPQQHRFIASTYLHLLAISCPNDGTSLLTHSVPYP
ncbi:hypothetical protein K439DRAFT_1636760 [Ramaria rubella]|nr:hypothetical protein K439DRAFT_1636760 [Ramaria rubella]